MLRLWNHINSKLFYKMLIIYSLLTVIPLALVTGLFYYRSMQIIETKIRESSKQNIVETSDKLDEMLNSIDQKAKNISIQREVEALLRNSNDSTLYPLSELDQRVYQSEVRSLLDREKEAYGLIDSIYIFNNSGDMYTSTNASGLESDNALAGIAHLTPGHMIWAPFIDHGRMISAMEIYDQRSGIKYGLLAVTLSTKGMSEALASYKQGAFFITNLNGLILASTDEAQINTLYKSLGAGQSIINKRTSIYSSYNYISHMPKNAFGKEIRELAYYAVLITAITWLGVLVLTIGILRHITSPLLRLNRLMRKAERQIFETISGIHTTDEIAQICRSYNSLITQIKNLIEKVYKVELVKKEAELSAIKAYINPHFLYNTLESISIMAKESGSDSVPKTVRLLSKILRFSITPGLDYVPLETEITFAVYYLQLHQQRYQDKIQWETEIAEELLMIHVPKLLLQPIIENAVIHGIQQTDRPGWISIRAYEYQYDLVLEVEDNGPGYKSDDSYRSEGLGTGLATVNQRIQLLYGETYGLAIKKTDAGTGTIVRVTIPMQFMEEEIACES
ncbi:sensor histidine kinase YesM [Paenibacillus sp. J23TS9]|uniref:sensor histidine kinase n=1 Tax=Paenibacillus sp. J23TS9 TaxID=2807193 RepID=UPI001B1126D3|nr:sensor histidine kinase [Paenibacillus sp. J23TS9]GIP29732.1 sensor histidine kinase YesM [Paenibacillus sp. J23TS9]